MTTNVPAPSFTAAGFVPPTDAQILAGVQADINAAFGGNLNPSLSTPQGQLATSMAALVSQADSQFANIVNQVDPATATDRMQDAIARMYFLERDPAQPTVAQATCTGLTGVVIPVGALAIDIDGNIYTCTAAGTIPISGSIVLPFACNVAGPIVCPAGTLNTIYQVIPGWNTVNNLSDGVIGNNVESRAALEARRAASVALNSVGSLPSVLAAVLSVAGVLDAYATENVSSSPVTIGGATLAPKSLYVAVVGGAAQAVANAIWSKKAPGCAYNGNTTLTVVDSNSGYSPPLPSYQVTFEIPPPLAICFSVNIANSAQVPANAVALIQAAIVNAFSGGDGGPRARIGSTIYATRFIQPIAALGPWVQIISLLVGTGSPPATLNDVVVQINQVPTLNPANIVVTLT